jgi:hypothetical protein
MTITWKRTTHILYRTHYLTNTFTNNQYILKLKQIKWYYNMNITKTKTKKLWHLCTQYYMSHLGICFQPFVLPQVSLHWFSQLLVRKQHIIVHGRRPDFVDKLQRRKLCVPIIKISISINLWKTNIIINVLIHILFLCNIWPCNQLDSWCIHVLRILDPATRAAGQSITMLWQHNSSFPLLWFVDQALNQTVAKKRIKNLQTRWDVDQLSPCS